MSQFTHGVYSSEVESRIKGMISAKTPVVVVGTAPINMGDITNVNKAQLITSLDEANKIFGGISQHEFTIHEALNQAFNVHNVKPVICINVLDPKKHSTEKIEEFVVLQSSFMIAQKGVLLDSIEIKKIIGVDETEINSDEYIEEFQKTGELKIILEDSSIAKVKVSYSYLDISKVSNYDIIGGIQYGTTIKEGLECLNDVFLKYNMIPGIVIAPGFSADEEVRTVIEAKIEELSSKFRTEAYLDLPHNIEYADAIIEKKKLGMVSANTAVFYGKLKLGETICHMSTCAAFLTARIDSDNGGVPYESPSNKNTKMTAVVIERVGELEEIRLDEYQANFLNENGIITAIHKNHGLVLWGNRTACFMPGGNTDPKDMWLPVKRMFHYISNNLVLNTEIEVDKPMTYNRADFIKRNANMFLQALISEGKLLGATVDFLPEENPLNDMLNGKFKWHINIGGVLPGETIKYLLEYDASYQESFAARIGG